MNIVAGANARPQERGAISIKALFGMVVVAAAAFVILKIAPVYIDERQINYRVDDLANKSAVRNTKEDDIKKAIDIIRREYNLPDNSITLVSREAGKVQISVVYQKDVDLLVTTYKWKVNYTSAGKDI